MYRIFSAAHFVFVKPIFVCCRLLLAISQDSSFCLPNPIPSEFTEGKLYADGGTVKSFKLHSPLIPFNQSNVIHSAADNPSCVWGSGLSFLCR